MVYNHTLSVQHRIHHNLRRLGCRLYTFADEWSGMLGAILGLPDDIKSLKKVLISK